MKAHLAQWHVTVDRTVETEGSVLAFGLSDDRPVVLKLVKHAGNEWRSGAILRAFEGRGVVRVLEYDEGALLLEHLRPGTPLARMALNGRDEQATEILADVIGAMAPRESVAGVPTVAEWGESFDRCEALAHGRIPEQLLAEAREVYLELSRSQSEARLLHGDLHQGNVLLDAQRGWLAIDPKGVIGELEYEVGCALRNPCEDPELFLRPATIRRRVAQLSARLELDSARILAWAFAQAVLATLWELEDRHVVEGDHAWLALARVIQPLLRQSV